MVLRSQNCAVTPAPSAARGYRLPTNKTLVQDKNSMASTNTISTANGYSAVLDDAERASRDEIIALQTRRMAWTLAHAYDNVAHYKKAFDRAGVKPQDFRQLSDLSKFPFTVKTDLR